MSLLSWLLNCLRPAPVPEQPPARPPHPQYEYPDPIWVNQQRPQQSYGPVPPRPTPSRYHPSPPSPPQAHPQSRISSKIAAKPVAYPHRVSDNREQELHEANQENEYYLSLRTQAKDEGARMGECFGRSQEEYSTGSKALAKQLSNEGKTHKSNMEDLHKQASDWIFTANNKDREPGEVDLHGLFVKEALMRAEDAIVRAKSQGYREIRLIVGKGLHSRNGEARIKPEIEKLMQSQHLVAQVDPRNEGVLIVHLDGSGSGETGVIGADDIAQRLERDGDSCVIM